VGESTPSESSQKAAAEREYRAGLELASDGQHDQALIRFQAALAEDPLRADAHYRAGLCHYELGKYELEAAEYRKSLAISPHQARVWRALALARVSVDDLEGARKAYLEAHELEPDPRVLYNLALVEDDLGRRDEATRLLRLCLEEGEVQVRQRARQSLREWGVSGS
jgi:tetratricopeptide (TPR) repeat protein